MELAALIIGIVFIVCFVLLLVGILGDEILPPYPAAVAYVVCTALPVSGVALLITNVEIQYQQAIDYDTSIRKELDDRGFEVVEDDLISKNYDYVSVESIANPDCGGEVTFTVNADGSFMFDEFEPDPHNKC